MYNDDVYYHICQRLKLEGEMENMGVCTKERKGDTGEVVMATPCTNSLGEAWALLKIPRGDIDGGGRSEVTVTSEPHT